jgi:hypothetical protein
MHVSTQWAAHLAEMGNRPGKNRGDVTLVLIQPVENRAEWVVPSAAVTVAAEAGCLVGVQVELPDGRRAFFPGANVLAIIDHWHSHTVNGAEMGHDHRHGHALDGIHNASDPHHMHLERDIADLKPVKAKVVIRSRAAAAGGHSAEKIAAAYEAAGDEVLIALSNATGDEQPPVMLSAEDYGQEAAPVGFSAPNVIDGTETEIVSWEDLEGAECQLAAAMTAGGDEFGLSAADDMMAADTTAMEINRLGMLHQADQLRAAGHRVPRGFTA